MILPLEELQRALYEALERLLSTPEAGGVPVFDCPPENQPMPFVAFGDETYVDAGSKTQSIVDAEISLHAVSSYQGRAEVKRILEAISTRFDARAARLEVPGWSVSLQSSGPVRITRQETYHEGILTVRFRVCKH